MFHLGLEQDVERLRQAALLLEAENKRLWDQVAKLTRQLLEAQGLDRAELQLKLLQLEEQLASRNRALFGKSTEKRPASPGEPVAHGEQAQKAPQRGHGPREQRVLALEERLHTLDEADKACPSCGGRLEEWAGQFEESEEIELLERRFVKVLHKRQKYRCKCNGCVETAPAPVKLVEGARYSINFAVEVAIQKYADHLPLERQARIFEREGLVVSSQAVWDQVNALAKVVEPLHEKLHQQALAAPVLGADETRWELFKSRGQKPDEAGRCYAWTLSTPDVVYHQILETRSAKDAKRLLGGYAGIVMADGYGVYRKLEREGGSIKLAACWAHVRRKFVDAEPHFPVPCGKAIELIGELYAVEREAREAPGTGEEKLALLHTLRQERSVQLVAQLHDWARKQQATTLPQSSLGKALGYMLDLWLALTLFLSDARIPLDNNAAERGLRGLVVGRKNHYGSRSKRGTQVASVLYSLIETCKLVGVEPKEYLRNAVLSKLRDGVDSPLPHQLAAQARAGPGSTPTR